MPLEVFLENLVQGTAAAYLLKIPSHGQLPADLRRGKNWSTGLIAEESFPGAFHALSVYSLSGSKSGTLSDGLPRMYITINTWDNRKNKLRHPSYFPDQIHFSSLKW